jgi:Do/DeqQ family serine protease
MKNAILILFAGILGGVITLASYKYLGLDQNTGLSYASSPSGSSLSRPVSYRGSSSGVDSLNEVFSVGFGEAADKSLLQVVHIRSKSRARQSAQRSRDPFHEFFGEEYGSPFQRDRGRSEGLQQSSGSGVIIRKDGYIITNNHVVENSEELEVSLNNKRLYKAKVIGTDPSTDLALIKIDEMNLPFATFANSDQVRVGDWVLAVGNPFDLASTVTAGIVSAKARNIHILQDNTAIESFIQTDAAVNPGNSGGALVDLRGNLIGINTAIATPTGTYAGYAFAVPSNIVAKIVDDFLQFGSVQRAFLGITIQDLDWNLANDMGLKVSEGVLVNGVVGSGAAAQAGIKQNDVVVRVNDRIVRSSAELLETVAIHRPGDQITVTVNRSGKEMELDAKLKNSAGGESISRQRNR